MRTEEQGSWSQRRRARRARHRVLMEVCGECDHPWVEHLGSLPEADDLGGCGECAYEVEHGERRAPLICRVTVQRDVPERARSAQAIN